MLDVLVRTLRWEMSIGSPNRAVADALAFLKCDPEIEGPQPPRRELMIEMVHGFPSLELPSGVRIEGSGHYLLTKLYRMLFSWRMEELPGFPIADCATITTDAGHMLLIREKGQGTTTLLLHLMALGWPVAGWKHLFVSSRTAMPNPLPLRVPVGMLRHLPGEAADVVRALPSMLTGEGSPIYSVSPTAFGHPWNIRSLPVRQVILVHGNQGGRSRLRRVDWKSAMERVLKTTTLPPANRAHALAHLGAMISAAECLELWNGTVDESRRLLEKTLGQH